MKKLDLKREYRDLYLPSSRNITVVRVPKLRFLMIDGAIEMGEGPSTSPGFQEAMMALYSIAYTTKFMCKLRAANPIEYPVMALEGLWWVKNGVFDIAVKDNWLYTMMILTPKVVTQRMVELARNEVLRKRGENPALKRIRLNEFAEGLCMQVMHIGPYSEEPAAVERMRTFAAGHGYEDLVGRGGKHHEIYMGDPRKASPSKLKTVLRHPIRKAS